MSDSSSSKEREEEETFIRKEMSDSSSSPSTWSSPSPPSEGSNSPPPSSNSSLPSNSSPPADNSKGSPSVDSSPPSPTSTSPPPEDDSQDSPPSKSSPPSSSNSSPPSSKASPPPPISSPPPPDKDNSPSTPPPPKKDDSPSTPLPPPPPNNNNSPPPPKKDDSSSTTPPPTNKNNSPPPPVPPPPPPSSESNSTPSPPPPPLASPDTPPPPNLELMPPSSSSQSFNAPPPPLSPPNVVVVSPPPSRTISPHLSDTKIPPSQSSFTSSSLEPTRQSPAMDSPSSSSTRESTKDSLGPSRSSGNGAVIGVVVSVVALMLVAVFLTTRKRKRRRLDTLDHRPPPALSIRSDGSYYRRTNPMGGSIHSGSYEASQKYSSGASGVMVGSNKYGYPSGPLSPNGPTGLKSWFTYEELMDVTDGFSKENLIGEGGFGCVYKGVLLDGRLVAVKQLKAGSGQGEREFRAEVEIISRVHHRHLVSLVGYCIAEYQRLLVYEFLSNNTLEHHLHGLPVMDWPKRRRIAIGSAKGLAYLHEDCHPRIIHRDIKSANILLEDSFEPQVADFGLAKLSDETNTHVSTRVMGTFGYMAPEYASSGKLTDRSDVFSFGVVLLEIITGRKPVDTTQPLGDESLVEWARPLLVRALETGNCDELVDQRLENNYNKAEMFIMIEAAAACVRHSAPKRPRMVQVMRAMDNLDERQDLSNGLKLGESLAFNSNQYSADIQNFHRISFGYQSGEYDRSGEFRSQEQRPPNSYESDARPMFQSERSSGRGFG